MPRRCVTLRILAIIPRPPVSLPVTCGLVRAQLREVDLRRAVGDAEVGEVRDLVHHRGDVQQRLRRDAAPR
jgi:hypothetical protein